ncbi:MAG: hypothetical protein RI906_47 [Pseudomonadota bacterium]|jgi:DNA-binding response OmpR family regulator
MDIEDVLLVEDNDDLREEIAAFLEFRQFSVKSCERLESARQAVHDRPPRLAVIDLFLPDGSGLDLIDVIGQRAPHCRKLVLSARSDLDLKLEAYRRGADAYLIKPIDLQELAALIQASLKRAEPLAPENHWSIDTAALRLRGPRGETVSVSLQEARVLTLMAESVRHFASRRDLIEAMGFEHSQYDEQRLEAMISRLRRKLTPLGDKPIKAVHGQGYVFTQKIVAEVLTG